MLVLLLVMLMTMTNHTTAIVRTASSRVDAFQTARMAFDTITRRLSQATMNTYWDYYNSTNQRRDPTASANFVPATYGRASDLHFLIQANSHFGQSFYFAAPEARSADATRDQAQGLLNAIGYFVQYGGDDAFRPGLITKPRYRYRLMQAIQPTENFQVYSSGTSGTWMLAPNGAAGSAWPIADNVIALIAWPRLSTLEDLSGTSISTNYQYDSRVTPPASGKLPIQYAQMPPTVQVTMVVIDEPSSVRMDTAGNTEPKVISDALANLFTDVTKYQQDLDSLTGALSQARINYEVFGSTVSLRESKWSSQ